MYMHHLCAWHWKRPEEASDALELEIQMAVNYHVVLGSKHRLSARAPGVPNADPHPQAHRHCSFE